MGLREQKTFISQLYSKYMALLKNYSGGKTESPILFIITTDFVQQIIKPNLGRVLTEKEVERMHYALLEEYTNGFHLTDFILQSAKDAMDNNDGQWDHVDEDYEKRKPLYTLGNYQIGENKNEN